MHPRLHPLVASRVPELRRRRHSALERREFDDQVRRLEAAWATKPLPHRAGGPVDRMAMILEFDAALNFVDGDSAALAGSFRNAMAFRCLAFRWLVFVPPRDVGANVPLSAWDTVKVAGPAILGQWDHARTCVEALVTAAHIDQQYTAKDVRAQYWGKGTVDALLIQLLSGAFGISTHYEPVRPIVPVYRELLRHWRTTDEALFRRTMDAAAQFHIDCSGDGTDDVRHEFEASFAQIFPLELLAVQALRRRDALPAFETGHALIDAPWATLRDLPEAPPHPLLARVEGRLRMDYPSFR